jgi:hypothetical protein
VSGGLQNPSRSDPRYRASRMWRGKPWERAVALYIRLAWKRHGKSAAFRDLARDFEDALNAAYRAGLICRPPTHITSRYRGVSRDNSRARNRRWKAAIKVKGRSTTIGRFATEDAAARAYDRAARELLGPRAKPNFPRSRRSK